MHRYRDAIYYGYRSLGNLKKEVIGDKIIFPINDQNDLKNFVDEKILESNFSTNLLDAHMNINTKYKIVEPNDQKLIQNYLIDKGKQANEIYSKYLG